ncbi:histidine-containing phosphotransfer protein 1-like isoform X1 [Olea europaea var. sylvestris]|uniref:histidine-containing phosphotransfer protein 1-like isoform X1 n=1 Tax=Olea europaea var. sylvestris TaxID=158386 RepID=UPI000C1D12E4|nr:histidine-containing phosphotransfer protein 1-like isoform X1 [Olea europaea var. sylvestris]
MEVVGQLQRQYVDFITSLFREAYLDDQYVQLQKLQDDSNPEFVGEVVSIFFEDSEKLLNDLASSLQQQVVDFKKVDGYVHQFKGSSSSVGAQRVKNACVALRNFCEEKNLDGCSRYLNLVKQEFYLVKNKLETLLRMEQQILQAGGTVPLLEQVPLLWKQ